MSPRRKKNEGCSGCLLLPFQTFWNGIFGKGGALDVPRTYTTKTGKKRTYIPKHWLRSRTGRPMD